MNFITQALDHIYRIIEPVGLIPFCGMVIISVIIACGMDNPYWLKALIHKSTGKTMDKSNTVIHYMPGIRCIVEQNHHANQSNPNNVAHQSAANNHANQLNPNNSAYQGNKSGK